ncbi:MAG: hypothetical protein J5929_03160 [Eubacterium sp.]|nr:hypothetical protein [Eubacterium sp.]
MNQGSDYDGYINPGEEYIGEGDYYSTRPDVDTFMGRMPLVSRPMEGNPVYGAPPVRKSVGVPVIAIGVLIVVGIMVLLFVIFSGDSYKPGKTAGNSYRNEYFGIRIRFDSDMVVAGYAGRESRVINRLKSKKEVVTEVQGQNIEDTKEMSFDVAYMEKSISESGRTEKEIVDSYKDSFAAGVADPSYEVKIDDVNLDLGGKNRYGYILKASAGGQNAYAGQFFFFKDNYAAVLSVFGTSKEEVRRMAEEGVVSL